RGDTARTHRGSARRSPAFGIAVLPARRAGSGGPRGLGGSGRPRAGGGKVSAARGVASCMVDAASQALADAIVDGDLEAAGRALRHDVVIVPLLLSEGEAQLRVAQTSAGLVLPLFSSSEAARGAFGD